MSKIWLVIATTTTEGPSVKTTAHLPKGESCIDPVM